MSEKSKLAVISFILVISVLVVFISLFAIFYFMGPNAPLDEGWILTALGVGLVLLFIGLVLSIISLFIIRKNKLKGKGYAITALVISAFFVMGAMIILYFIIKIKPGILSLI